MSILKLIGKGTSVLAVPGMFAYYYLNRGPTAFAREADKPLTTSDDVKVEKRPSSLYLKLKPMFKKSKSESRRLVEAFRVTANVPGVVCAVSYQGKELWAFGQGLADVETRAPCTEDSVMRIASISKSVTMLLLGQLLEEGKLDLDKPISEYLNEETWPVKMFEKKKVDITLRQLVSHLGGIRSYKVNPSTGVEDEFYLNEYFENVNEALRMFKDDDLISRPGDKYLYTTHGFTLISAVIQSVLGEGKKFETELLKVCRDQLRMTSTYLDTNEKIIANRAKYYTRKEHRDQTEASSNGAATIRGDLINVKEVDNSYKWAGGGLLSSVHDLLKFGNAMLYSFKTNDGILKPDTVRQFWTPRSNASPLMIHDLPVRYGMGFEATDTKRLQKYKTLEKRSLNRVVFHTGAAVGVTSILLILPEEELVVAIMANLYHSAGIAKLSMDIAKSVMNNMEDVVEIV